MKHKNILLILLLIVVSGTTIHAADRYSYLHYPIFLLQYQDTFVARPTPAILFNRKYLLNRKEKGHHKKITFAGRSFLKKNVSYTYNYFLDGKKSLVYTFVLKIDHKDKINYPVSLILRNLLSGRIKILRLRGTAESFGEVVGGFLAASSHLFDLKAINKRLAAK